MAGRTPPPEGVVSPHPPSRPAQPEAGPGTPAAPAPPAGGRRRIPTPLWLRGLAAVTAVLLGLDAWVHFTDAGDYAAVATAVLSEAALFRVEAAVAVLVAIALLVRPHPVVWAAAVLVAGGGAAAVLLYTSVDVGAIGPVPDMYEPTWALPGKPQSAVAEVAATVLALTGLVASLVLRRRAIDGERRSERSGSR
jgi:hypothetical protein